MIRNAPGVNRAVLPSVGEARELLVKLGAPRRLIQHGVLVGEAAELLIERLRRMGAWLDADFVRLGAILHDAGKTLHVQELSEAGHAHEQAGEELLRREGVTPALARCCVSHAAWDGPER